MALVGELGTSFDRQRAWLGLPWLGLRCAPRRMDWDEVGIAAVNTQGTSGGAGGRVRAGYSVVAMKSTILDSDCIR
jgi:hypothetical protein